MKFKSEGSLNIADLFLVMFIGLKITGQINWSWWWVLSPIWIVVLLSFLVFIANNNGRRKW